MNNLKLAILILLLPISAQSQKLEISIDTLKIYSIKKENDSKDSVIEITMHDNEGPYIEIIISIFNNSDSVIKIRPGNARYYLQFNFEGEQYKQELFPLAFTDLEQVDILPKQSIKFNTSENLFYGTPIYSIDKTDYTEELLKTLPTLKIVYKQSDISLESSTIVTVELPDQ